MERLSMNFSDELRWPRLLIELSLQSLQDWVDLNDYYRDVVEDETLPSPADLEIISRNLKTRTYHENPRNNESSSDDICCAVCLKRYEDKEKIGTLQCGHEYHADCVKEWLSRKKSCPLCRAPNDLLFKEKKL